MPSSNFMLAEMAFVSVTHGLKHAKILVTK